VDRRNSAIASVLESHKKFFVSLFMTFVAVAFLLGFALQTTGIFQRQELQTINQRFEMRPWLVWAPESLKRLNATTLWNYHQKHEIPRNWYNWDFTLSWLLENNHPAVKNNVVIFNRMLEDEPPDAAISSFPWMEPLSKYPLPRKTVAEMVDFLAANGAAAIILDNDFPQHADGDDEIAKVVDKWSSGAAARRVPIFMVQTVNSGSDSRVVELGTPTRPVGVVADLQKRQPNTDIEQKFLGTTCVIQDEDQVVRSMFINRDVGGKAYKAIVVKALEALGKPMPADLPQDAMEIDFTCPPRSDLYPTRPLVYLLDPQTRATVADPNSHDVHIKDAIVFIGDGVTDVYSTSFTGHGNNQMAGTEILAQAMDTISRHSWPVRLNYVESLLYIFTVAITGGALWVMWKLLQAAWGRRGNTREARLLRLIEDLTVSTLLLVGVYFAPCLIFSYAHLWVPMFVPTLSVGFAILSGFVLEREREREEKFQVELRAADEKLALTQEKYEAEIKRREAEAQAREALVDKKRRHEFVRRINHDLNAPVSVLNWTVSELQMMELENEKARDKVLRLVKSSDKLCELIDQLVQSYDYETVPKETNTVRADLGSVVHDCVDGQVPHATMNGATLDWKRPDSPCWVRVNELELTRVVDNLIRNAVKHNPEGTRVTVSIESNGRFHTVAVADNGKGIAAEHLSHIFEPGYRVEPNKKTGQGLGLDIAKTLIEGMGGEISVESVLRKGTTFKLKIPMCEEEDSATGPGEAPADDGPPEKAPEMVLSDGTIEQTKAREGNGHNRNGEEHD
jgi:signal transduction histidine kinase